MILLGAAAIIAALAMWTARFAPAAATRMAPKVATITLTALVLTVSLVSGLMLCVAGGLAITELVPGARPRDWSLRVLQAQLPIPPAVGAVLGTLAAVLITLACWHIARVVGSARRTTRAAGALPCVDGLSIVDDHRMVAYAVPGREPRIVVSTGMLRALTADQRRALLAHERSHLRHRHHVYTQLARLAAAANPLMRSTATAVVTAVERWADADAAVAVGDHVLVASALGEAALRSPKPPSRTPLGVALGATQSAVLERVQLLLDPPRRRATSVVLLLVVTVLCWVCSAAAVVSVHAAVELAETVTRR